MYGCTRDDTCAHMGNSYGKNALNIYYNLPLYPRTIISGKIPDNIIRVYWMSLLYRSLLGLHNYRRCSYNYRRRSYNYRSILYLTIRSSRHPWSTKIKITKANDYDYQDK
uniref:Putative ovule protein n=1 Tax=Solanum chacoense TaxID=4108 RepID=A0A0V0GYF0_SOLCH